MLMSDKWRGFIVGAIFLLLALTACQTTEPATTGAEKLPTATTTIASTATPEIDTPTAAVVSQPTDQADPLLMTATVMPSSTPNPGPGIGPNPEAAALRSDHGNLVLQRRPERPSDYYRIL